MAHDNDNILYYYRDMYEVGDQFMNIFNTFTDHGDEFDNYP